MDLGLQGRVALITGASGGIGRALAQVFADEGAQLALLGNSQFASMREWVQAQPWADRALCLKADQTDPTQVNAAFKAAADHFGRIDTVAANAGAYPQEDASLHEASVERIRRTVEINLMGTTWTVRAFMGTLARTGPREGSGASLVIIGSTAGRFGEAFHADYAMCKSAFVGMMHSVKNELVHLDPYARINLVEPGWTVTHMARESLGVPGAIAKICQTMPLRQLARASDIARMSAFLCSDAARHISGQTMTVAGGMEGRVIWPQEAVDEPAVRARVKQ